MWVRSDAAAGRIGDGGRMTFDRNFWGGISLVAIWLAVLFVGVFGGNVETHSAGGDSSSWPVVVIVAIVALLATVSIGRWAFRR
jgi:hypothetical protein